MSECRGRPVAWSSAHLGAQGAAAVGSVKAGDPSCPLHALHTCLATRAQRRSGFLVGDRLRKSTGTKRRAKNSGPKCYLKNRHGLDQLESRP